MPRFEHPPPKAESDLSSLNPKPVKKPRPPAVPEHLRKHGETPVEELDRLSQEVLPKKPRVPKVAEILPDAKIKKKESRESLESRSKSPCHGKSASKLGSPKKSALDRKKEKEKSVSPRVLDKPHKTKKLRSPKQKIKKGQVIIYNAAGIPVACYDNMPSPKR